jgi:hypothetical protein
MDVDTVRPDLLPVFAATTLRTYGDTEFVLVSLPPRVYFELLTALAPLHDLRFQAIIREPAEVSLIAPFDLWARIAGRFPDATVDVPWKLITLDISIPLDVYGYLEHITHLCAQQGSSVIVASGYSTDHLLIAAAHYPAVLNALQAFLDRCRAGQAVR